MEIQHMQQKNGGRFYIDEPDESVTEIVYKIANPHKMIIEHTEVGERYEGKGIGKKLVAAAVDYARQNNMKVLPMCPYAKTVMERTPEYHDILATYN